MAGFTRVYIITYDAGFERGRETEYQDEEIELRCTLDMNKKDIEDLMFLVFARLKQSRFPITTLKGLNKIE